MKIRHSASDEEKITLQMTPMIDIVLLLLVFFVMTFKLVSQEGDCNIKMPLAAPQAGVPDPEQLPPMRLRLRADSQGNLASIVLNDTSYTSFQQLNDHIIAVIGSDSPASRQQTAEVELECDYQLRYQYVIQAITAVSGRREGNKIIKLIEKIRFAPPQAATGGS